LTVRGQSKISWAHHGWLFTRRGEERRPLLALHPRKNNEDHRRVTFVGPSGAAEKAAGQKSCGLAVLHRSKPLWFVPHANTSPTSRVAIFHGPATISRTGCSRSFGATRRSPEWAGSSDPPLSSEQARTSGSLRQKIHVPEGSTWGGGPPRIGCSEHNQSSFYRRNGRQSDAESLRAALGNRRANNGCSW
jgi:hypothetical protein